MSCGYVGIDADQVPKEGELEEDKECDTQCIIANSSELNPLWVGCDQCDSWFHTYCLGLQDPDEFIQCENCLMVL